MFEPLYIASGGLESLTCWPSLNDYQRLLSSSLRRVVTQTGKPLRLIPPGPKPRDIAEKYEPRIFLKGEMQIREANWHDLFNLLAWMTFPKVKAAINWRHYTELSGAEGRQTQNRGPIQDALTLFDEEGLLIASSDEKLTSLLKDFEWKELFCASRQRVLANMKFYLFGHSLYEKALQPFIGMTGRGIIFSVEFDFFDKPLAEQLKLLDERLGAWISDPCSLKSTQGLAPVPLLGVPGWSQHNASSSFYENTNYFRARSEEKKRKAITLS